MPLLPSTFYEKGYKFSRPNALLSTHYVIRMAYGAPLSHPDGWAMSSEELYFKNIYATRANIQKHGTANVWPW